MWYDFQLFVPYSIILYVLNECDVPRVQTCTLLGMFYLAVKLLIHNLIEYEKLMNTWCVMSGKGIVIVVYSLIFCHKYCVAILAVLEKAKLVVNISYVYATPSPVLCSSWTHHIMFTFSLHIIWVIKFLVCNYWVPMHWEIHVSQASMQTNTTMWKIFPTNSISFFFLKTTFNQESDRKPKEFNPLPTLLSGCFWHYPSQGWPPTEAYLLL